MMNQHEKLDYVEFQTKDIQASKTFFTEVFGWSFEDFGADYTAFSNQGLDGGFFSSDFSSFQENGGALLVFYSQNLEATQEKIVAANGVILKPVFDFPGGQRFHFSEPGGNEFAVWSDASLEK